ncbi:MAG: ACT domain-containing protein [Candidatus Omnitrophica bacterium]|nr:ACT domain-containing protein [Candidatus Omnitrophota bacterium]
MRKVVVTVIGKDEPGIVSSVTGVLYENNCNIEDASMTILGSEFAMIMIVALPKEIGLADFQKGFKAIEKKLGLTVTTKELPDTEQRREVRREGVEPYIVSVLGADRAGIVHKVSKVLADCKLNITDVNSRIIGEGTKSVYALVIEVDVPKTFDIKGLEENYKTLGKELGVDITVRKVGSLSL